MQPLVSRPGYGEGHPAIPTASSGLPGGGPSNKGLPLSPGIPGESTFAKPVDDIRNPDNEDEPIERVDSPNDLTKDRDRIDTKEDNADGSTSYNDGKPYQSPKTPYPYRDDKPNTHNASVEFVVGAWLVERAPELFLPASRTAALESEILWRLDPEIEHRSRHCQASLRRADIKNLRWLFSVNCGNGAKVVKVKAMRVGNVVKFDKLDLHVACSCPAWRWQGPEYHAVRDDYQDPKTRLQGTASTPDIRDPRRTHKVCKHVAAVLAMTKRWEIPKGKKR